MSLSVLCKFVHTLKLFLINYLIITIITCQKTHMATNFNLFMDL